jgi:hypothetical protein
MMQVPVLLHCHYIPYLATCHILVSEITFHLSELEQTFLLRILGYITLLLFIKRFFVKAKDFHEKSLSM